MVSRSTCRHTSPQRCGDGPVLRHRPCAAAAAQPAPGSPTLLLPTPSVRRWPARRCARPRPRTSMVLVCRADCSGTKSSRLSRSSSCAQSPRQQEGCHAQSCRNASVPPAVVAPCMLLPPPRPTAGAAPPAAAPVLLLLLLLLFFLLLAARSLHAVAGAAPGASARCRAQGRAGCASSSAAQRQQQEHGAAKHQLAEEQRWDRPAPPPAQVAACCAKLRAITAAAAAAPAAHRGEAGNLVAQALGLNDGDLLAHALVGVEVRGQATIVLLNDDLRTTQGRP